jgi:centromeric protein E
MATRPASRHRKPAPSPAAKTSQPPPPPLSASSPTSTATTTSSSRLTPEMSLDGPPASPRLVAGMEEDQATKENVTVTVRFRPLRFRLASIWTLLACGGGFCSDLGNAGWFGFLI